MENLFFSDWQSLLRISIITLCAYIAIILILRISGKRSLSKMNAFDFVVTIALGSSLATIALDKSINVAEGSLVFLLFILFQFIITWFSVRINLVKKVVSGEPILLLYNGEPLHDNLKKERVPLEELFVAARANGISDLSEIDVIVLETTGDFSIIPKISSKKLGAMRDVKDLPQ